MKCLCEAAADSLRKRFAATEQFAFLSYTARAFRWGEFHWVLSRPILTYSNSSGHRSYYNNSPTLNKALHRQHTVFVVDISFLHTFFPRGSFLDFITCHISVYKLLSHFHIHHCCQSKCGVRGESPLEKSRITGCMVWTEAGENHWCGMDCRCERVEAGFTVLISGWPAVFTS